MSASSSLVSIPSEWQKLKLFSKQSSLPPLPLPTLAQTIALYERSVQPLLRDDAERTRVHETCKAFLSSDVAHRLHSQLVQRTQTERNWLESWWLEFGYLRPRYPIAVVINFFAVFDAELLPSVPIDPFLVAGSIMARIAQYRQLLLADRLEPEMMGKVPLDMSQIARLFTTTRVPDRVCDQLVSHQIDCADEFLVIVKHQHFIVRAVHADGTPLHPLELAAEFRACHIQASARPTPPSVGMLTAGNRTRWAEAYETLSKDHANRDALQTIERVMYVLSLDDDAPATDDEAAALALAGNGHQRWYDKLGTLIVFSNGRFAGNGEHCAVDAPATNTIFAHICNGKLTLPSTADAPPLALTPPPPRALHWNVTPAIVAQIAEAEKEYGALRADLNITLLVFREWGREHLKSRRASPDTVVQMALQLAQMLLHKTTVATYETAQTRQFQYGRTETVRTASIESKRWCEAVASGNVNNIELAALLREAINSHNTQMARCTNGQGIDRHLMGLRVQATLNGEPLPPIFDDVYARSTSYHVSTSQVHFPAYTGGFSAATADGYGVCYSVQPNLLRFALTSWKSSKVSDLHAFKAAVITALHRVDELLAIAPAKM